jgi:prepilin-type N-terminal cleavage/methylation domain-containing protein
VERTGAPTVGARARIARDDRGFTLIESITAAVVLLVIAAGVMTVLISTAGWYAKATVRTQASAVAAQAMAVILSRNNPMGSYLGAGVTTTAVWPDAIPVSRNETTPLGVYSVDTSMALATDPATGLVMTRVIVSAYPASQTLDPPVSLTRYTSGWQEYAPEQIGFNVPVTVQCINDNPQDTGSMAGIRVQLLDPETMAEDYYAVTDATGTASFINIPERPDGYFLTSDPRFGTDMRPVNFPTRKLPTHGGSISNPILIDNKYSLHVMRSSFPALLRVGVFRGAGWRFSGGVAVSTPPPYSTVDNLTVYAQPTLNVLSPDAGMNGIGNQDTYPPNGTLVYSATVNAYGIACIQIPWTTDPSASQYWTVWCTTQIPGQQSVVKHVLTCSTAVTGGWTSGVASISRPELPSTGAYTDIPQWSFLGSANPGPLDPTPPQ